MAASASLVSEDKIYGEFYTDFKLKHSEKLMFLIEGLLDNLRMTTDDINIIACSKGPGSFTGLRIGAATAKAIAHAKELKIAGVSSLMACAYQNRMTQYNICTIFDAQQKSLYCAIYRTENDELITVKSDCVIPLEDLLNLLKQINNDILFCGDAVKKYSKEIKVSLGKKAHFAPDSLIMPHASSVGMLALKMKEDELETYDTFLPEYIRKSQAEVNYSVKI